MNFNTIEVETDDVISGKKSRLVELLRAKRAWIRDHQIYYYHPIGNQIKFHQSKALIRIPYGTNRSGKTLASVAEDIALCLGFRPWMLPEDLKRLSIRELLDLYDQGKLPQDVLTPRKPPVKLLIIEDDWDVVDEILITGTPEKPAKIRWLVPPEALVGGSIDRQEKNGMGYVCRIRFINGSTITLDTEKSYFNDRGSFEGKSFDVAHYDEPKSRELRVAVKRGLVDTNGMEIFSLTPLAEPWMYDELYARAGKDPDIEAFYFSADTLVEHGVISKEGWESFVKSLTEDEKEVRAKGRWVHLKGLVYKEFRAEPFNPTSPKDGGHLIDPLPSEWVYEHGTVYVSIDPHARQNMACSFLVADEFGRWIVWDELFEQALIAEFCDHIKSKLCFLWGGEWKYLTVGRWQIDPIATIEDPIDKRTWALEFHTHDVPVVPASKDRARGIRLVQQSLADRRLLVCRNCTRTIWEFQHYMWDEWQTTDKRGPKEKPRDKDDHLMECLYRNVIINPQYIVPEDYDEPIEPVKGWCT